MQAVRDRLDEDRRFLAAVHGVQMQDRHGQTRGRRLDAMARMKARRGGRR